MTKRRPPVVLLWGEDPFLLREAAREALGDVQPNEVDGAEWQGGETGDLATPSLFGEQRALLVEDAKSLGADAARELAAYLEAPAPDALLVLSCVVGERGKAPAALVKLVEPAGEVRHVAVARKDLPAWILDRAKRRAIPMAPDAARTLVETIGEDPAELDQAVSQLASAFPGERVTGDLVHRQFRGLGDRHIWDLCDRAFGKDLPGAVRALGSLLESRAEGLMIVGGIAARLRDLLRVRALPDRMPLADLARAAGLRFDWQARRYRDQARKFSMDELVALHARVVEADRALKSGAGEDVVLPVLVSTIARERAAS